VKMIVPVASLLLGLSDWGAEHLQLPLLIGTAAAANVFIAGSERSSLLTNY